jgi:hypothetical protein
MKKEEIIGTILIIIGVILGLYLGVWLCFIGGIINVIQAIRAENLIPMDVAIGVMKVMFSGFLGYTSAAIFVIPGLAIFNS